MTTSNHDDPWRQVQHLYKKLVSRVHADIDLVGEGMDEERASVEQALRAVMASLEDLAKTSAGAVRDPKIREDLVRLLAATRDAVRATVSEVRTPSRQHLHQGTRSTRTAPRAVTHSAQTKHGSATRSHVTAGTRKGATS